MADLNNFEAAGVLLYEPNINAIKAWYIQHESLKSDIKHGIRPVSIPPCPGGDGSGTLTSAHPSPHQSLEI